MAIHTFFCFPETAGKSLEDIEEMFLTGVPAWKTKVDFSAMRSAENGMDPEKVQAKAKAMEQSPERREEA
jgi:hypothetical protein